MEGLLNDVNAALLVVVTIFGTLTLILTKWTKVQDAWAVVVQKHQERKNAYLKSVLDGRFDEMKQENNKRFDEMDKKFEDMHRRFDEMDKQVHEIEGQIVQLSKDLYNNTEATATIALREMMWAYHYYVLEGNPIPLDVRTALCCMFDQYKVCEWHNHIPEDFKERLYACDIVGVTKEA